MTRRTFVCLGGLAAMGLLTAPPAPAATKAASLLQSPDLHGDRIVFTYADDLWTVSDKGGEARRLTDLPANKLGGRFSPDGQWIAFSAERGGNLDIYVVPASGGAARRLTWHGMPDFFAGWTPDSRSILFRSRRTSFTHPVDHLFTVPVGGGAVQALPLTDAGPADYSPTGTQIVYNRNPADTWTPWRGYRGGRHSQLAVYDLQQHRQYEVAPSEGNDLSPSWVGNRIYFASDRAGRMDLYAYDVGTRALDRLTHNNIWDVRQPRAAADGRVVYESGGKLHVLDTRSGADRLIEVSIGSDFKERQPRDVAVPQNLNAVAPVFAGTGAIVEARGELLQVDAAAQRSANLTRTSGVRERSPAPSPDGKWIAYISDATGEYQIYLRATATGAVKQLTKRDRGYPDGLRWSPDSRAILFTDETQTLYLLPIASGTPKKIATSANEASRFGSVQYYEWAPDARSVFYSLVGNNQLSRLYRYDASGAVATELSDGSTDDFNPVPDSTGERIYFLSARNFAPSFSDFEQTFNFNDTVGLYSAPAGGSAIASQTVRLPVEPSSLSRLGSAKGKLFYLRRDRRSGAQNLQLFDLATQKEQTLAQGVDDYSLVGDRLLVATGAKLVWYDVQKAAPAAEFDLSKLTVSIDPAAEWRQIFREAWRLERDYFYDPHMAGVDWEAVRKRYEPFLPQVATRRDLNMLITRMVGELGTSHSYAGGGDLASYSGSVAGLLGADLSSDGPRYRITRVFEGDAETPAPLRQAGVSAGTYILAVNGRELRSSENIYERLENLAGKEATLTVGPRADGNGAREIKVRLIGNDMPLRYLEWLNGNRRRVAEATNGRVGYIHVPNTGRSGMAAFARQFFAQSGKDALIIDNRWNSGGLFPASMIEHLQRRTLAYYAPRNGRDLPVPTAAVDGPKLMLTNQYAASGGDAFAIYFRAAGLGPIVGTRTGGATIGNVGMPALVDGGEVAVAALAYWKPKPGGGEWAVENQGVKPDVEVEPAQDIFAAEQDPQLARAIYLIGEALRAEPARPARPPSPSRRE